MITTQPLPKPLYEAALRSGVKTPPPPQVRVRIIAHTAIRGVIVWAGTVVDVLQEDYLLLRASRKAEKVSGDTPLFNAPQPPEPSDLFPARIVELVSLGLNTPKELATELGTTLGTVLKIVKALIAEGKIAASDKGYTIKKA